MKEEIVRFYHNKIEPDLALYLVIVGEGLSSLMLVMAKLLESDQEFDEPMSPFQILTVRMVITYAGTVIYMKVREVPDAPWGPPNLRKLLFSRGFLGFIGVVGLYVPLNYISVSDCIVISFLAPSLTTFLAYVLLKERVTLIQVFGGIASLGGVILIARPTFIFGDGLDVDKNVETSDPQARLFAIIIALLAVLGNSSVFILIRHIGHSVNPVQTIAYYALITAVGSTVAIAVTPGLKFVIPTSLKQWALMIGIGFTGFFSQFLFTTGLQREKASRTSMMVYTQIVFALLWEYLVWHHTPNIFSWLGIVIVLGSAFLTVYFKPTTHEHDIVMDEESATSGEGISLGDIDPSISDDGIKLKKTDTEVHQRELTAGSTLE